MSRLARRHAHNPPAKEAPTICRDCRTVLNPGERCTGTYHRTIDTSTDEGRKVWMGDVWGEGLVEFEQPRRPKPSSTTTTTTTGAEDASNGCGGCLVVLGGLGTLLEMFVGVGKSFGNYSILPVVLGIGVAVALLVWVVHNAIGARRQRPAPRGAHQPPPNLTELSGLEVVEGVVESASSPSKAIGSGTSCAAWGAGVHSKASRELAPMIRYGTTTGLVVVSKTGHRYQVPSGRVRVTGEGERFSTKKAQIRSLVGRLLEPSILDEHDPVPHDYLVETRVHVGDNVRLRGVFESDGSDEPSIEGRYRKAVPRALTAHGEVELEVLTPRPA